MKKSSRPTPPGAHSQLFLLRVWTGAGTPESQGRGGPRECPHGRLVRVAGGEAFSFSDLQMLIEILDGLLEAEAEGLGGTLHPASGRQEEGRAERSGIREVSEVLEQESPYD